MENRIYALIIMLIMSCLGQTVHAAELIQKLGTLTINFTNLAKKITGRPLPAIPPGKQPPPVASEEEPKFSKSFSFAYAQAPDGKPKYIKIGLVAEGDGYNLVVYGPKLTDTTPQDFIVKQETSVPGQALPKIEERLSFPVDKAKNITWSSSGVLQEGPLASFILIKATDYKVPKQKPDTQKINKEILPRIKTAILDVSILPKDKTPFKSDDTAKSALKKIQKVTAECTFILENNLLDDTKKEINDLREKVLPYIEISLQKAYSKQEIRQKIEENKEKLNNCLKDIADRQKKHILYSFYETYLKVPGTPTPIDNWWVARERKIKGPAISEKPEEEPTGSLNLTTIVYKLEQDYFEVYRDPTLLKIEELFKNDLINEDISPLEKKAYSELSDEEKEEKRKRFMLLIKKDFSDKEKNEEKRKRFMLLKTNYENPATGKFFNLKELLAYFIQRVPPAEYTLMNTWNFRVRLDDYTWPAKE